jgi:hypothetical protein
VAQIIAEEKGLSLEEVTKKGPGSNIVEGPTKKQFRKKTELLPANSIAAVKEMKETS